MTVPMSPNTPERRPYTQGQPGYPPPQRVRPKVDARMLWSGGVATAIVAGLLALVGVLVCRWLFNVPILAPRRDGAYGNAHTTTLVLVAAAAALLATLLAHLLLVSTPRPTIFFGWIVGLVTVIVVVFPFRTGAALSEEVATAALYLVIGIAIGTLIAGVGERATRLRAVPDEPARRDYPGQGYPGDGYRGQDYPGQGYPGQTYQGRDY
jgi:uncharacterized protein DUF6069